MGITGIIFFFTFFIWVSFISPESYLPLESRKWPGNAASGRRRILHLSLGPFQAESETRIQVQVFYLGVQ